MNLARKTFFASAITICWLLQISDRVFGQILLQDDFNDNILNTSLWYTVLPFVDSHVVEQNQRMEFSNRGYLVTQSQFNPSTLGGIRIRGQYTFTNATFPGHDIFQIVTRSTGTPGGGTAEITGGLSFMINGNDALVVNDMTNGFTVAGPTPIPINDNESFAFEIRDNGTQFQFSVNEIGGDGSNATLSGTDTLASPLNHITFYNRESNNGFTTLGFLDNVIVDVAAIPEPSSILLIGLTTCGIGVAAWVKRCRLIRKHDERSIAMP